MDPNATRSKAPSDLLALLDGAFGASEDEACRVFEENGWTLASLVDAYLSLRKQLQVQPYGYPSLECLSRKKIFDVLSLDVDFEENLCNILKTLDGGFQLRVLLTDGQLPYLLLRKILRTTKLNTDVDLDECVLRNDAFIRRNAHQLNEERYLISGDQLIALLRASADVKVQHDPDQYQASDPNARTQSCSDHRDTDFLVELNYWVFKNTVQSRSRSDGLWAPKHHDFNLVQLMDNQSFARALDCLTAGFSKCIPWDNVIVAGRQVHDILRRGDRTYIQDRLRQKEGCFSLDLFVFGVQADGANDIVESILASYSHLYAGARFFRNSRSLQITSEYGGSIQIVLRLFNSKVEVLSSHDLDVLAVGFDGHEVLMLPRCARALETGNAHLFTMDLPCNEQFEVARGWGWCDTNVLRFGDEFASRAASAYLSSVEIMHLGHPDRPEYRNISGLKYLRERIRHDFGRRHQAVHHMLAHIELDDGLQMTGDEWPLRADAHSQLIWQEVLQPLISNKLGIDPPRLSDYRGYLTRRVRRYVDFAATTEAFQRRQIAIPLLISESLETVLRGHMGAGCPETFLFHVYDSSYQGSIPPLHDSKDPDEGNLRFFIISTDSMWAGQNETVDEVFEILRCLAMQMDDVKWTLDLSKCSNAAMAKSVLTHIRARLRFHEVPRELEGRMLRGKLESREEALLKAYVTSASGNDDEKDSGSGDGDDTADETELDTGEEDELDNSEENELDDE